MRLAGKRPRVNKDDVFSVLNYRLEMMMEQERRAADRMARKAKRRMRERRFKASVAAAWRGFSHMVAESLRSADATTWFVSVTLGMWSAIACYWVLVRAFGFLRY